MLRSWRHYPRAQSQERHTTDQLEDREYKEEVLNRLFGEDQKGLLSIGPVVKLFQRQCDGNVLETGSTGWALWVCRYQHELNRFEARREQADA